MGPHPAVAAIRLAVRRTLADLAAEAGGTFAPPGGPPALAPLPIAPGELAALSLAGSANRRNAPDPHGPSGPPASPNPDLHSGPDLHSDHGGQNNHGGHGDRGRRLVTSGADGADSQGGPTALIGNAPRHPSGLPRTPAAPGSPLVLVAVSGGADSMALATAAAFEGPKLGLRVGAVTVDHGLQSGSADRAEQLVERLRALGLDPVEAVPVTVGLRGGPEAAARDARYTALDEALARHGAVAVLLGHTRDDQAETVLLGLARGSGSRSLAGMPAQKGRYRRPLLELDRSATRQACTVQAIPIWDDPHNCDPAYTRSRVRHEVLPVLEKHLGGGVVEALARTARLFRDDADALDQWAALAERDIRRDPPSGARPGEASLDTAKLAELPSAVRRRVLRRAALRAGCPAGDLFARHLETVDQLVTGWRGQGPLHLPGGVEATRRCGTLVFRRQSD